jgi:hypothetical protein
MVPSVGKISEVFPVGFPLKKAVQTLFPFENRLLSLRSDNIFLQSHLSPIRSAATAQTTGSKIAEGNSLAIDVLSAIRNGAHAGALFQGANAAAKIAGTIGAMTIAGGVMSVVAGMNIARTSAQNLFKDYVRKNWEGGFNDTGYGLIGISYGTTGAVSSDIRK